MVSGSPSQFRRESPPVRRRPSRVDRVDGGRPPLGDLPCGTARRGRGLRRRAARRRRRARRSRRGLPDELPRSGHRHAGDDESRRDLVELFSGFRRRRCHRPLRTDRTRHPVRHRRVSLQRQDRRRAGARRRVARPAAERARNRHDRDVGRFSGEISRPAARPRAVGVRPSGAHSLLLGDDRTPQGHRARRRWHVAAAPERAVAARRRAAGRPRVLLHDHWLDDVELVGERLVTRGDGRALRWCRIAGGAAGGALGSGGTGGGDGVRHQRQVSRVGREVRAVAGAHPRSLGGGDHPLHRESAGCAQLRLRVRSRRAQCVV